MTTRLNTGIPTAPLTDPVTGQVTPAWRAFFLSLWMRTGGSVGQSTDTSALEAALAAEEAARVSADLSLTTGLANEAALRGSADAALDANLKQERTHRIYNDNLEIAARQSADALLVPKAELCSLWAACDLSFLPASDPGGGMPWLDGKVVTVGTNPGAIVGIGLEDGANQWSEEDLSGIWIWG